LQCSGKPDYRAKPWEPAACIKRPVIATVEQVMFVLKLAKLMFATLAPARPGGAGRVIGVVAGLTDPPAIADSGVIPGVAGILHLLPPVAFSGNVRCMADPGDETGVSLQGLLNWSGFHSVKAMVTRACRRCLSVRRRLSQPGFRCRGRKYPGQDYRPPYPAAAFPALSGKSCHATEAGVLPF
jgi:hypothetical protein